MATIADGDVSYGSATKSDSASFVPYDQWGAPTEQQGPTKYTADVRSWGYQAPEKCVEALVRSLLAHALMSFCPRIEHRGVVGCGQWDGEHSLTDGGLGITAVRARNHALPHTVDPCPAGQAEDHLAVPTRDLGLASFHHTAGHPGDEACRTARFLSELITRF